MGAADAAEPTEPEARPQWPFTPHGEHWYDEMADAEHPPQQRWDAFVRQLPKLSLDLPPGLVSVDVSGPADESVVERSLAALARDGAVVLANAVPAALCDELLHDLEPYRAACQLGGDAGLGMNTKRVGSIVARSAASYPIVAHPVMMQLCDALLGRQVSPPHSSAPAVQACPARG